MNLLHCRVSRLFRLKSAFNALIFLSSMTGAGYSFASPQFGDATSIQVSDARVTSDHSSYIGVIEALTREGFVIFVVEETLLNRIRILSRKDTTVRETIVSGSTGAILRDNTWQE